jgi:hypothetical protein
MVADLGAPHPAKETFRIVRVRLGLV